EIRKAAKKEGIEDVDGLFDELYEVAEVSLLNRGRLAGQILDEVAISKIKSFLSKNKVELQIGNQKGVFEVDGYFYPSGKTVIMESHNAAMFITDGIKMKMVLRENATVLEFLHEFMHFNHCKSLGIKNYYNLKGVDGLIARERFVFDKLAEHKQYLNREELIDAKGYMNKNYNDFGITDNAGNPIRVDFDFNISQIPKKRQEVNIDKLLNLK
ncbi:MAG: zincin-like metallopeptidase toxin domain-containing protein, partial [Flavobacterium sp.]|nr:zincin-like metallopeptidase toxin domain-containing protein [Flavobacterium sp.]